MSESAKSVLQKYVNEEGTILNRESLNLEQWYELEDAIHKLDKEASKGTNYDCQKGSGHPDNRGSDMKAYQNNWINLTDARRMPDCLLREIKSYIKKLGGKAAHERRTIEVTQSPSQPQQSPKATSSLNAIRDYFQKNDIQSISLNGADLLIKYNNGNTGLVKEASFDSQQRQIQSYLQSQGNQSIDQADLIQIANQTQPSNSNWWIVGGSIVIAASIIGLCIYFALKTHKSEEIHQE